MFFGYMGAVDGMSPGAISDKIKNNLWTSVSVCCETAEPASCSRPPRPPHLNDRKGLDELKINSTLKKKCVRVRRLAQGGPAIWSWREGNSALKRRKTHIGTRGDQGEVELRYGKCRGLRFFLSALHRYILNFCRIQLLLPLFSQTTCAFVRE